MLYKKRWSDGLHNDFDHLDEFEAKFYCFGGDGGGSSGGGSSSNNTPAPDPDPSPNTGFRGEQSAAPTMSREQTVDAIQAAAQQSLDAKAAPAPQAMGIADMFPDAMVNTPAPAERPSLAAPVSFAQPTNTGIGSLADFSGMSVDFGTPVNAQQAYSQATNPNSGRTLGNLGKALGIDIPDRVDIGGYNVGFGPTPGSPGLAGVTVDLGPGTLGFGTNRKGDAVGLGYNMKFAQGGIVTLPKATKT